MVQWMAVSRDEADKAYIIGHNREGATITQNLNACFDMTTSFDGIYVHQSDATDVINMAGVADQNIADNAYGRIQAWGYRASIYVSNEGTSITITKGDWCQVPATKWGLSSQALTSPAGVVAGETITVSAAGYMQGFIRCI